MPPLWFKSRDIKDEFGNPVTYCVFFAPNMPLRSKWISFRAFLLLLNIKIVFCSYRVFWKPTMERTPNPLI